VLVLVPLTGDEHLGDPASAAAVRGLLDRTPPGWRCLPLQVDATGATVGPSGFDHDAVSF
jgi:homoserine kinase